MTKFVAALILALQNQQDAGDEQHHANADGHPPDDGMADCIAKSGNRRKYNIPTEQKLPRASRLKVPRSVIRPSAKSLAMRRSHYFLQGATIHTESNAQHARAAEFWPR